MLPKYKEEFCYSWKEVKDKFKLYYECDTYIFRGQLDSNWKLEPSLQRKCDLKDMKMIEKKLINLFNKGAYAYLDGIMIPTSDIETMIIMQHYGAPTRLLDWSKSPYVAAYFAFENLQSDINNVSIWVVNVERLRHFHNEGKIADIYKNPDSPNRFEGIQRAINSGVDGLISLVPRKMDQRMLSQQSVFLMPLNLDKTFYENMDYYENAAGELDAFTKITIPYNLRHRVLYELTLMNIDARTLFPGLDGFSRSLNFVSELKNGEFGLELPYDFDL